MSTTTTKSLSVVKRETFFDDSFFTEAWDDFDKAVQSVLDKFDTKGLKVDTGTRSQCRDVYRTIRSSKIDDDIYASQALQVTEKDGRFQCVMDVKDFNPNDLQVKVVEDRVVVEGKYEKKSADGTSITSKSFYKEFTLPQAANLDLVSTALSKDGVLTIKAPKKEGTEVVAASPGQLATSQSASSSVSEQTSSSVSEKSASSTSTSVKQQSTSSTVKKESFSSTKSSSFSSTTSSTKNVQMSSNVSSTTASGLESDLAKDMNDRLVFTHENVSIKMPENK